jgi:hypothetical protein
MKYEHYNPVDEKGGCVSRAISKLLNKDYNQVKEELISLAQSLGYEDYREIEVFETYLKNNDVIELNQEFNCTTNELNFEKGKYIIFGNKDEWYHMVCLIDNIFYDKNDRYQEIKVIKVYELK